MHNSGSFMRLALIALLFSAIIAFQEVTYIIHSVNPRRGAKIK